MNGTSLCWIQSLLLLLFISRCQTYVLRRSSLCSKLLFSLPIIRERDAPTEKFRKLIDFLHDEGIDSLISLPQIVVMGDTSSGKSSLLSGLSGIQFPSSDELTTRCPARLHMTRSRNASEETFASVHINWHTSSDYQQPFKKLEFTGKFDVEENLPRAIAAAQKFIIETSKKEVSFDMVEIHYTSQFSEDFSLVDIPGFVRSVGKGESFSIVQEVTELNLSFLSSKKNIIMAVLPANVDFHNSQILADALKVDPTTERIIPVITKPDLVDRGAENSVLDLLSGRKTNSYKLGFHIVKSRGQKALNEGVTINNGLDEEKDFFSNHETWKIFPDKSKMGTTNLRRSLAKLQVDMMKREVPNIVDEVDCKLSSYKEQLKTLGQDLSTDTERRAVFEEMKRKLQLSLTVNIAGTSRAQWKSSEAEWLGYNFRALVQGKMALFAEDVLISRLASIDKISVGSFVAAIIENISYRGKVVEIFDEGVVVSFDSDIHSNKNFAINEIVDFVKPDSVAQYRLTRLGSRTRYDTVEGVQGVQLGQSSTTELIEKVIKHKFPRQFWVPINDVSRDNSLWLLELVRKNRGRDLPLFPSVELFNKIISDIVDESIEPLTSGLVNDILSALTEIIQWVVESTVSASLPDLKHV